MKDTLIKVLVWTLWIALLAYTIRLWTTGAVIINSDLSDYNMVAYIYVAVIALFVVAIVVAEMILPDNRRSLFLLWVWILFTSHLYLTDDPTTSVYLKDILKLFWVFFIIAGPTKMLISEAYEEKKFEEEIEVIEV